MSEFLKRFRSAILSASETAIERDIALDGKLVLDRAGDVTVSYAPFEHIQQGARVAILGITPGARQAGNALVAARRQLLAGADDASALRAAKVFASFSGPMRSNLIAMLDHIGLSDWLGIPSTEALWGTASQKVHFTSALRFPVLVNGNNYSGQPSMTATPILRRCLERYLQEEALALGEAVWVPLGPRATEGIEWLVREGVIEKAMVLKGLPHPSGANAERIAYFLGRKSRDALSAKTSPTVLDQARELLLARVSSLQLGSI